MYKLVSRLVIYRSGTGPDSILMKLSGICRRLDEGDPDTEALRGEVLTQINALLDMGTAYGFNDNLWHNYLTFLLAMTETPFTLVSEKTGRVEGSVNEFVLNDLEIFRQLFSYDFSRLEKKLDLHCFSIIENYHSVVKKERIFNKEVSDKVRDLSLKLEECRDAAGMYSRVTEFYRDYGVGMLGLNRAFRVNESASGDSGLLKPITAVSGIRLEDLVGYEIQKKKLMENTEAFVRGRSANNVLLYGDAGTGKSSSIKAILNMYYPEGLRMIELYKHQFKYLSPVISSIKNRNYRFIIYMDDLSFEDFETDYKYLKAVIEGGLEPRPENVLIYATSNRRHLIRENFSDRPSLDDDDVHRSDSMQEKLSLSDRFGVTIGYFRPNQKQYYEIVTRLAGLRKEIDISEEELIDGARRWELNHGGFSGRTAMQYVDYLAGRVR